MLRCSFNIKSCINGSEFFSFFSCFLDVLSVVTWCNVIFTETTQIVCFRLSFLTLALLINVLLFAHIYIMLY